jgi:hypothetical protein
MTKHGKRDPGHDDTRRNEPLTAMMTIGAAGMILLLGAGAAYFLARASTDALATASMVLMTIGLVGLAVMTCLLAAGWSIRGRHDGRGPGGGRPEPIPIPIPIPICPIGDPDAELFRILDDTRLGDLSLSRRAHLHHRREGAA